MPSKPKNPGKSLETLVSSIERVLSHNANVSVHSPVHLPDRITGELREHEEKKRGQATFLAASWEKKKSRSGASKTC